MTRQRSSFEAGAHAQAAVNMQAATPLLTVDALAARLSISRSTLYRSLQLGELPEPLRIAERLRWDSRVVENWLANGCPKAARKRPGRRRLGGGAARSREGA